MLPPPRAAREAQGQPQRARELAERALEVAKKAGLREKEAQAYLTLGDVLSASLYDADDRRAARRDAAVAYGKAIDVLRAIGNDAALGKALFAFGRYKAETGDARRRQGHAARRDHTVLATRARPPCGRCREAARVAELVASASVSIDSTTSSRW